MYKQFLNSERVTCPSSLEVHMLKSTICFRGPSPCGASLEDLQVV